MSNESALAVATQAPTQTSTEAKPTAPQVDSKAFTQLAKKESELHRERQTLKAEKAKLESVNKQYEDYLQLKKTDPVAALKNLGFTETDIFNYIAQAQPVELTPEQKAAKAAEDAANAKIKAFEDTQAKRDREVQEKADQTVIQGYRNSVSKAIKAEPQKFEYCAYNGPVAEDLIYETVLAVVTSSKGKDVPTPSEAAQMVEDYYEEQDKAMSSLKKRQPKAPPPVPSKEPVRTRTVSKPVTPPLAPPRTLSGRATATMASNTQMSETFAQKRERLIEKLRNGG